MLPEDYYPKWLAERLLAEDIPWGDSYKVPMARFLELYTLHDSYWVAFMLNPEKTGMAIIRFDSFWAKDKVPYPGDTVGEWPFLLILFDPLYLVLPSSSGDAVLASTIGSAKSMTVTERDRERMLEYVDVMSPGCSAGSAMLDDKLTRTVIEDVTGGAVDLLHGRDVRILCLNTRGERLSLPGLEG